CARGYVLYAMDYW
nr:immunoglobulin heavy chain junction region [Mus musculus]